MNTCFVLAPIRPDLPALPSEAQELVNILSAAGWRVHLMQEPATRLELWRALDKGPFVLGWVGTHSGPGGFALSQEILTPALLGDFVAESGCTGLVLNSCFSAEHVDAIQSQASRTNIVATIDPDGIPDQEAWSRALFLVRRLVRSGNLRDAQRLAGPQYRWFPAPGMDNSRMDDRTEDRLRRTEETVEKLVRALQGETWSNQPGLITQMRDWMNTDAEWKRRTEERIRLVEQSRAQGQVVTISNRTVVLVIVSVIMLLGLLIYLVNLLAGRF